MINLLNPLSDSEEIAVLLRSLSSEDWVLLQRYLENHSLACLVYARLCQQCQTHLIPEESRQFLREQYLLNAARNLQLLQNAHKALAALAERNIPVIGIKGLYLLENIYADIGARGMNDLDILVRREDIPRTVATLQELSYQPLTYFDSLDANVDIKHVPPMSLPDGTIVEVHWTLLEENEPFTLDVEGLWQRSVPARFAESNALSLSTEDLLLHLCLHAVYQHYLKLGLRGMYDIALVIKSVAARINWDKLRETAKHWGAEKVATLTFALLQDLGWVQLPDGLLDTLLPEAFEPEILAQAKKVLLLEETNPSLWTPSLTELSERKNVIDKARLLASRIFLPRTVIARLYGMNPRSPALILGYLRRASDLFRQYSRTITRLITSEEKLSQNIEQEKTRYLIHQWLVSR